MLEDWKDEAGAETSADNTRAGNLPTCCVVRAYQVPALQQLSNGSPTALMALVAL